MRHGEVHDGEGHQEHGDHDPESLDGAQLGQLGPADPADLPDEDGDENRDVGPEAATARDVGLLADRQYVEGAHDQDPGQGDRDPASDQGAAPRRDVEVRQAECLSRYAAPATGRTPEH